MKNKELNTTELGNNILVLSPHPDDEILGIGGLIAYLKEKGKEINIVYVTNADSYSKPVKIFFNKRFCRPIDFIKIATMKQEEAKNALKEVGIKKKNIFFLCYPGGGLHELLGKHYSSLNLYCAIGTRVNKSPYENCYKKSAPFCGKSLLEDLRNIIDSIRPSDFFIPSPYDTHADHWATCIFTLLALGSLDSKKMNIFTQTTQTLSKNPMLSTTEHSSTNEPRIWTYLIHYDNWPSPKGLNSDLPLLPPQQLNDEWLFFQIPCIQKKLIALNAYKTVMKADHLYLKSFIRKNEFVKHFTPTELYYQNLNEFIINQFNLFSEIRFHYTIKNSFEVHSGKISNSKNLYAFLKKMKSEIKNINYLILYDYVNYRVKYRIRPKLVNFNWIKINHN